MKIVVSSHTFVDIRLNGMSRLIEINPINDLPITSFNILDAYALRLFPDNWVSTTLTEEIKLSLPTMSLQQFASKFHVYIKGKNKNLIDFHREKKRVIIFSPTYSSNINNEYYPYYCYYYIMKHKPWVDFPESLYNGIQSGTFLTDIQNDNIKKGITEIYNNFNIRNTQLINSPEIEYFRNLPNDSDEDDNNIGYFHENNQLLRDDNHDEDDIGLLHADHLLEPDLEILSNYAWNELHDWQRMINNYSNENLHEENVNNHYHMIDSNGDQLQNRRIVLPDQLLPDQLRCHNIIINMIRSIPTINNNRCALILGGAGSGKSFTLDAIVNSLLVEHGLNCHVCAPTGKAASNINGFTIYSKEGLKVPILSKNIPYRPLQGTTLKEYQTFMEKISVIIIDEFTMISQSILCFIDKRCREGNPHTSHMHFGGKAIIMIGDPAQLPPVKGSSLWSRGNQLNSEHNSHGYALYNLFDKILKLQSNPRLEDGQQQFNTFLTRLRNGNNTEEDCCWIREQCSFEFKNTTDLHLFNNNNAIAIHNTNAKIHEYYMLKLKDIGSPILKIVAKHTGNNALMEVIAIQNN